MMFFNLVPVKAFDNFETSTNIALVKAPMSHVRLRMGRECFESSRTDRARKFC